jgi:hypothetical protein
MNPTVAAAVTMAYEQDTACSTRDVLQSQLQASTTMLHACRQPNTLF